MSDSSDPLHPSEALQETDKNLTPRESPASERARGDHAGGKRTRGRAPAPAIARQADFTPRSMAELQQFAKTVSSSRMVPKKYRGSPQDIVVAVMHGMEIGLPPLQALQSVAVINGRPSIYGDAALALVKQSGLCKYVKEWTDGSGDDWTAFCKTKRKGEPEPTLQSFSWKEAKGAGLTKGKGPWRDYPRRMMQMRARSWCLRDAYPDVLSGLMLAEEAEAIPQSNGETLDPKGEMERPSDHTPQIVEWESPHGHVYEIPPGKKASLQNAAEALEREDGADLGAKIEQIRNAWDWDGEADTALDSLLAYHAQRLADDDSESSGKARGETTSRSGSSAGSRPNGKGDPQTSSSPQTSDERHFSSHEQAIKVMCPKALEWGQREDPPPTERRISSEKESEDDTTQLGRLFRIAGQEGWKDSWLDRLVKDELGFESKTHIPYGDPYDEICAALRNSEVRFWMSRDPDTNDMFAGKGLEQDAKNYEQADGDDGDANHPEFEDDTDLPF